MIIIAGLNSCDYLDVEPKGKFVIDDAQEYVNMLEEIFPLYNIDVFGVVANEKSVTDTLPITNYDTPYLSANYLWDESVNRLETSPQSSTLYNKAYARIASYNIVLSGLPDAKGDTTLKAQGIATAKIMRAYNHFFLVNTFAKMYDPKTATTDPGIILQTDFNMEVLKKQNTVAEVYKSIEKDIEESLANLPDQAKGPMLPGKAFGYALKAKVALFKRDIKEAQNAALEALKYGNELIDMIALYNQNPDNPTSIYWKMDNSECLLFQMGSSQMAVYYSVINPETARKFDQGDVRKEILFSEQPLVNHPRKEPGSLVFYNSYMGMCMMEAGYNVCGIGLPEVYLMLAETYARQDDYITAMKYLNDLRVKRILPEFYKPLSARSRQESMDLIKKERDTELVLTANKFFDMRRFAAEEHITYTKTFGTRACTLKPDSHLLIMPFPKEALENNPNLKQNSK